MTPRTLRTLSVLLALTFAACGGDAPKKGTEGGADTPKANGAEGGGMGGAAEEEHGERKELGKLNAFGASFDVVQFGDVSAGDEAAFELEFASGEERISTVRGWIGQEDGRGSMKSAWDLEGEAGMHGHVDVPAELPDGAKLWLELEKGEDTVRLSIAYK